MMVTDDNALVTTTYVGRNQGPLAEWAARGLSALTFDGSIAVCVCILSGLEHGAATGIEFGLRAFGAVLPFVTGVAYAGPPLLDFIQWYIERQDGEVEPRRDRSRALRRDPVMRVRGKEVTRETVTAKVRDLLKQKPRAPTFAHTVARPRPRMVTQRLNTPHRPRDLGDAAEFYDVLTAMWDHDLTRRSFQARMENGKYWYDRYIGPKDADVSRWEDRGIWKQWRIVAQVNGLGRCEWVPKEIEDVFCMNGDLREYAAGKGWII